MGVYSILVSTTFHLFLHKMKVTCVFCVLIYQDFDKVIWFATPTWCDDPELLKLMWELIDSIWNQLKSSVYQSGLQCTDWTKWWRSTLCSSLVTSAVALHGRSTVLSTVTRVPQYLSCPLFGMIQLQFCRIGVCELDHSYSVSVYRKLWIKPSLTFWCPYCMSHLLHRNFHWHVLPHFPTLW